MPLCPHTLRARFSALLLLTGLLLGSAWAQTPDQTPGGTTIVNQAEATFRAPGQLTAEVSSNPVTSRVPALCSLDITPNGSVALPGQTVVASPGATTYLPYEFVHTGNSTQDFLFSVTDENGDAVPAATIVVDANGNGVADATETPITELNDVAAGAQVDLLAVFPVPADASTPTSRYLNLVGSCESDPAQTDDDNLSLIEVRQDGVSDLSKRAVPADGTAVSAGQTLSYTVSFTVNERPLTNVQLSDVLDTLLDYVGSSTSVNGQAGGSNSYDETTRTLTATFAALQPGDEVALQLTAQVRADAPGGATITNRATLRQGGTDTFTNPVSHPVPAICGLSLTPDGTPALPAHSVNAEPGETVVLPYTLENTGNTLNSYDLTTVVLPDGDVTPTSISIVLDSNGNGSVDAGETPVTSLADLPAGGSAALLLVLELPETGEGGDLFVDIVGACQGEPNVRDEGNVARVTLPLGGFTSPTKTADPAPGTPLYPGAELSYTVSFSARDRDLLDVVVTDPLNDLLTAPLSFSGGTITDPASGLSAEATASYDVATNTLTWRLARVPAGMTVTLEVALRVREDVSVAELERSVDNTAQVTSQGSAEQATNTVSHPLEEVAVLLEKTAAPEVVTVGGRLTYTLLITNPEDSVPLAQLRLTDPLPAGVSYLDDSAVVTLPDGSEQNLEPENDAGTLTWLLPGLEPGEQLTVTFEVTVLPSALDEDELVNEAEVTANNASGRAVADAADAVTTPIDLGPFQSSTVLLGTVFVDMNGSGAFEHKVDIPVEGVRLYLSDGRSLLSDERGRYTFLDLTPGLETLKVDTTTLPPRLLQETLTEDKPGLWRVRLWGGLIARQDVPLQPPGARLEVDQTLTVTRGPVTVTKRVSRSADASDYTVLLSVTSSESLKGLNVTDVLPDSATVTEGADSVTLALEDVAAGFETGSSYTVQFGGEVEELFAAPLIVWSVR